MGIETDVMDAAAALKLAVDRAQAAGYHVNWPLRASDIGSIAVSETRKVALSSAAPTDSLDDGGVTTYFEYEGVEVPPAAKPKKPRT